MATPHAPAPAPSSLARSTLMKMGARIAVLVFLTTLFSYLHIFDALRTEALVQLERSVVERGQREQAIFVLAEDNQAILKKALEEHLQAWSQKDPRPAFEQLAVLGSDGTWRSRPETFDGTRMPCVFVPRGQRADDTLLRQLLAAHEVVTQYGPAFHVRFIDLYVTLPGGAIVLYWPDSPQWCKDATADFDSSQYDFFTVSTPEHDPQRGPVWSGIVGDPIAHTWTVSSSMPLDVDGRHVATLTQDILIEQLMARTVKDHLPGAYNMLLRDDGQLLAHPELSLDGATEIVNVLKDAAPAAGGSYARMGSQAALAHLRQLFEWARSHPAEQVTQEFPESGEFAASVRLKGPGWNLVTVLPERVVSANAVRAARYVLGFGVVSLALELAIMYWVLKQQITRPLLALTQATSRLETGDFQVELDTSRTDELGRLAHGFQRMAGEVQRREEALRQANELLEQRVEERTRQLQEVHRQLVETARQVGRAEVATNVLHNVGNVLNSVHTSAVLARERLGELKLDSVERVVNLMDDHRANLTLFLTEDERGRNALPFLRRLGKYMQAERQALHTLLTDVSRHTEHIGAIVKLQQQYARAPQRLLENVSLAELVDDALRLNQEALDRHGVQVERELAPVPELSTEKHKVLMILINLISNAKYALDTQPAGQRRLRVSLEQPSAQWLRLRVSDNGMGIAPEMLTRIFNHGFTTRTDGHGFGLHSSALAAQEMGGSLVAHSDGPGQGATFTLELPTVPETRNERAHG